MSSRFVDIPASESIENPKRLLRRLSPAALMLAAFLIASTAPAQECLDCHEVQIEQATAHAEVECVSCHVGREEFPHPENLVEPACERCHSAVAGLFSHGVHGEARAAGNEAAPDCSFCHGAAHTVERPGTTPYRRATVDLCSTCHPDEAEQFQTSIHGTALAEGNRNAPNCVSCHGEHTTHAPHEASSIRETCAQCHGDVQLAERFGFPADRIISFDESFHGLAVRAGSQRVANCASCHGYHHILPSTHPESMTHPANLPTTCGECHPGAGRRFSLGPIHVREGQGQAPIADIFRMIYLFLIPLTIGLMIVHNAGDWTRKLIAISRQPVATRRRVLETRMLAAERVQHALLAVSFILLTWTGFALKFPDQLWAWPLIVPGPEFRGDFHRIAALVFIATAVLHLITLVVSRTLRNRWTELIPKWCDVREAMTNFAYNIGLRRERPTISEHSYIEKAEYWAVVWGAIIMSATGIFLWADNFFLTWLPKWAMDVATVIHYYEAILAALAIVIWHFYAVMFDPNVYPLSMAWLNGRGPKRTEMSGVEETAEGRLTEEKPEDPGIHPTEE